jgi:hypothetical protein
MTLTRFDGPRHLTVVAAAGGPVRVGASIPYEPDTLPDRVRVRATVDRLDDYTADATPASPPGTA